MLHESLNCNSNLVVLKVSEEELIEHFSHWGDIAQVDGRDQIVICYRGYSARARVLELQEKTEEVDPLHGPPLHTLQTANTPQPIIFAFKSTFSAPAPCPGLGAIQHPDAVSVRPALPLFSNLFSHQLHEFSHENYHHRDWVSRSAKCPQRIYSC